MLWPNICIYFYILYIFFVEINVGNITAIAENTNLRSLDVCDVSSTSPALLGSAFTNVEEVVLYDDQITREQMEALLVAIVSNETLTLRKLVLFSCPIHNIDPELLGTALNRL